MNNTLYYFGLTSCITGPLIAYFDRYSDVQTHSIVTVIFTSCEVLYVFIMVGVMNTNIGEFKGKESMIALSAKMRYVVAVVGGYMLYNKIMDIDIGGWGAIGEWIVFEMSFAFMAVLA